MDDTPKGKKDPLDELLEAVERPTLTWDYETEPTILGHVIGLDERSNEYGSYPVFVLLTGDGREVEVLGQRTVLRKKLRAIDAEVGDQLAVKYLGQHTPRSGGKEYHDYKVVHRDSNGQPKQQKAAPPAEAADALDELEESLQKPAQSAEEPF
jgi:hypothetical protein